MESTMVSAFAEESGNDVASGVIVLDEEDTDGGAREEAVPSDAPRACGASTAVR